MTSHSAGRLLFLLGAIMAFLAIRNSDAYGALDLRNTAREQPLVRPALIIAQASPSATYTYDRAGRTATVLYTDQTCVVQKYNAQGNRTDVAVTKADTPETSVWGSGAWGCSKWDHP